MTVTPLVEQLADPCVIVGLLLYVPFALWPLLALARSPDPWRIGWTGVALVAGLVVLLQRFTDTPPFVYPDVPVTMGVMAQDRPPWLWLWLEQRTIAGAGWNALPWYLFNRATGTYLGERVVGLFWYAVLVLAVGASAPRRGVPLALAFLFTPPVLWLSRHAMGTEILAQQVALLAALDRLRRGRLWFAPLAGLLTGALQYTYVAARVVVLYPALWLWKRPLRALVVYLVFALAWAPMWAVARRTNQAPPLRALPGKTDLWTPLTLGKVRASFGSLFKTPVPGSWGAFSYPGAQTIPRTAWAAVAGGALFGGWRYLPAAFLGLAPDLVGPGGGVSHRQMMVHVPLLFVASSGLARLPRLVTGAVSVAVAAEGISIWLGESFWRRAVELRPPPGGFYPCATPEPPRWCPGA
ncbi:MAG: hypothetical protein KatS3mg076_1970 [Candidatus Binatia bacterium]|nr:MAG: hypothetical protein KatS3mg076_1970 [Candidatus Binatia bacterium]